MIGGWLVLTLTARAAVPMDPFPECGEPDRTDLCPPDLGTEWELLSYVPEAWQANLRPEEVELGTGSWADRAWRTTPGRTDVLIAVLDSGIKWDEGSLLSKHFLNAGELPLPQDAAGNEIPDGDLDGNGVFNIDDWAEDPRVDPTDGDDAADGVLDPSDLIAVFSDGVDDDGNGFVDDISGWDFLWNDNDPYDDTRFGHGTGEARGAAAEGDDDDGSIGSCPNCMVMSVRVGDSFVVDGQNFASGVLYAVDMGASVVQEALGSINHADYADAAIGYAWEKGALVVASAADESSFHANTPGRAARTLYVNAVRPDGDEEDATSFLALSACTNHGPRVVVSVPAGSCSSGATERASGVAGLLYSAALDAGTALSAGEAWQLFATTTDDIDLSDDPEMDEPEPRYYPTAPGWDRYTGFGRINAWRSVNAVLDGAIPPVLELDDPDWFEVVDPDRQPLVEVHGAVRAPRAGAVSWTLEAGWSEQPGEFVEVASGTGEADGLLAEWDPTVLADLDPAAAAPTWDGSEDQVAREDDLGRFAVTLRLTATDDAGVSAELRRTFFVRSDPDVLDGLPLDLGSSLEASPLLVDLDGDGVLDVVQATSGGEVHALSLAGGEPAELPGWPFQTELLAEWTGEGAGSLAEAPAADAVEPGRASVVASPAAGDVDGDGRPEVAVATLRGAVHLLDAEGSEMPGFPVYQDPAGATDPDHVWDEAFLSSPALADLDGDGDLEIVIGGQDQQLYAWHHDGTPVDGFPVTLMNEIGARIVSSPATGDLDGDGADDVVIGTNEVEGALWGLLWAVSGATGEVLPGWPARVFDMDAEMLPYIGTGNPNGPALGDVDGDGALEVVAHGVGGPISVFEADGSELAEAAQAAFGADANVDNASILPFIDSPSLGDLDGDGTVELVSSAIGSGLAEAMAREAVRVRIDHAVGAWHADGSFLDAFPRVVEDMQFLMNPTLADVDGDGSLEILVGSGGYLIHAFSVDGSEPAGWPRFTGQWTLGAPAVGDVDGDGALDVVVGTRSGWLWAWRTASDAGARVAWQSFGHDPRNTANLETPLPEGYFNFDAPGSDGAKDEGRGCGCGALPGAPGAAWWPALALALAGFRRRDGSPRRNRL